MKNDEFVGGCFAALQLVFLLLVLMACCGFAALVADGWVP